MLQLFSCRLHFVFLFWLLPYKSSKFTFYQSILLWLLGINSLKIPFYCMQVKLTVNGDLYILPLPEEKKSPIIG
jgi:hypothetical protein